MSLLQKAYDARIANLQQLTMAQFKAEEFDMKVFVENALGQYKKIADDADMFLLDMLGGETISALLGGDIDDGEIAFMKLVQVATPAYSVMVKMMDDFDAGKWPAFVVAYKHLQEQQPALYQAADKLLSFLPDSEAAMAKEMATSEAQFYGVLRTYGFAAIATAPLPAIPHVLGVMTDEEKKTFASTMNAIAAERGDQQIIDLVKKATGTVDAAPKAAPKRSGGPKP